MQMLQKMQILNQEFILLMNKNDTQIVRQYNTNKYDTIAIIITNNHIGKIEQVDFPKPKFLIEPFRLNRKSGFNFTKIINMIINNNIAIVILFFLTNDLYIIYYYIIIIYILR